MIDKTINNIKKILYKALERILTAKILEKKYFTRFWRGYLQQKQQIQFFLSFLYIKGVKYKMPAIGKETYGNSSIEVITDNLNMVK